MFMKYLMGNILFAYKYHTECLDSLQKNTHTHTQPTKIACMFFVNEFFSEVVTLSIPTFQVIRSTYVQTFLLVS